MISRNDIKKEGAWLWQMVDQYIVMEFTAWLPNEPNDEDIEECLIYVNRYENYERRWNDLGCRKQHPFICEWRSG